MSPQITTCCRSPDWKDGASDASFEEFGNRVVLLLFLRVFLSSQVFPLCSVCPYLTRWGAFPGDRESRFQIDPAGADVAFNSSARHVALLMRDGRTAGNDLFINVNRQLT